MTPEILTPTLIDLHRAGRLAGVGGKLVAEAAAEEERRRECKRLAWVYRRLAMAYSMCERASTPEMRDAAERLIENTLQEVKK